MTMDTTSLILIFFYGQLWWCHSADIKEAINSSPTTFLRSMTALVDSSTNPTLVLHTTSDPIQQDPVNIEKRTPFTTKPIQQDPINIEKRTPSTTKPIQQDPINIEKRTPSTTKPIQQDPINIEKRTPSTTKPIQQDPVKNETRTPSTTTSWVTTPEPPQLHDGHVTTAVLIGVILLSMIAVIVGVFLWKRWRQAASPVPHWAGRSPFADGEVLDVTANKEITNGTKRTSVLSLLPWKLNKETQLLENVEGQLSESRESLGVSPAGDAEETVSHSRPTITDNSASLTSIQTSISDGEGPSSLADIPLQPAIPELLDLPPPPNWINGINEGLCPNGTESLPLEPSAETQCILPPEVSQQNLGEVLLLPPPPEDFI